MARYILRYHKSVQAPASDLKAIRATPNISVVDESPRMVLVDADEEAARASVHGLSGWSVTPETVTPLPRDREEIR